MSMPQTTTEVPDGPTEEATVAASPNPSPVKRCSRTAAQRRRREMVAQDPRCRRCHEPVIEIRKVQRMRKAKILECDPQFFVRWVKDGVQHRVLVATIHHRVPRALWDQQGRKGSPNRRRNLIVLCPFCHRLADAEALQKTAPQSALQAQPR